MGWTELTLALVGLIVAIRELHHVADATSLTMVAGTWGRLQDLTNSLIQGTQELSEDQKVNLVGSFFNELEFLAVLVRKKKVERAIVVEQLGPTILAWHDRLLVNYERIAGEAIRERFENLKWLVGELRQVSPPIAIPAATWRDVILCLLGAVVESIRVADSRVSRIPFKLAGWLRSTERR